MPVPEFPRLMSFLGEIKFVLLKIFIFVLSFFIFTPTEDKAFRVESGSRAFKKPVISIS